jgi:hypothetical protein
MTGAQRAEKKQHSRLGMLVARVARAKLDAAKDLHAEEAQHSPAIRLASMLLLCLMPVAAVLFVTKNNIKHYASQEVSAVLEGCWAILGLWVVLDKGMVSMFKKDTATTAWFLLGIGNLIAALGTILFSFMHS